MATGIPANYRRGLVDVSGFAKQSFLGRNIKAMASRPASRKHVLAISLSTGRNLAKFAKYPDCRAAAFLL